MRSLQPCPRAVALACKRSWRLGRSFLEAAADLLTRKTARIASGVPQKSRSELTVELDQDGGGLGSLGSSGTAGASSSVAGRVGRHRPSWKLSELLTALGVYVPNEPPLCRPLASGTWPGLVTLEPGSSAGYSNVTTAASSNCILSCEEQRPRLPKIHSQQNFQFLQLGIFSAKETPPHSYIFNYKFALDFNVRQEGRQPST